MRLARDGFSVDAAISKGRDLPDWYLDEPEAPAIAPIVFKAFRILSSCRAYELGPIPWTAVYKYGFTSGLSSDNIGILFELISAVDSAYIAYLREELDRQQKRQQAQAAPKNNKRR